MKIETPLIVDQVTEMATPHQSNLWSLIRGPATEPKLRPQSTITWSRIWLVTLVISYLS